MNRLGGSPGLHLFAFTSKYPPQHSGTVPFRMSGSVPLCQPRVRVRVKVKVNVRSISLVLRLGLKLGSELDLELRLW
jgi:hypothetical protein